jgi:hypothetical protein
MRFPLDNRLGFFSLALLALVATGEDSLFQQIIHRLEKTS